MKAKTIVLGIKSIEESLKETKQIIKNIEAGKITEPMPYQINFKDISLMRKMITEQRLKILRAIKKYKPESVYKLAKILDRDIANVHSDINFLADMGLIVLDKSKKGREKNKPKIEYDSLLIKVI